MGIDISDLPVEYQRQALEKMRVQQNGGKAAPATAPSASKGTKFHNQKATINGIKFDSKKEAARYKELMVRLNRGEIDKLKLQPQFTLVESYITPDGERVRGMKYIADFSYRDKLTGLDIVEDVKSKPTRTRVYINKIKLMRELRGITVREI